MIIHQIPEDCIVRVGQAEQKKPPEAAAAVCSKRAIFDKSNPTLMADQQYRPSLLWLEAGRAARTVVEYEFDDLSDNPEFGG